MGKVKNFDSLGEDFKFTYRGKEYTVPAITQSMSEKLSQVSKKLQDCLNTQDYEEANRLMFEYVAVAMSPCHKEQELRKELPKLVISEVMKTIGSEMLMAGGEVEGEDKEQAKKT